MRSMTGGGLLRAIRSSNASDSADAASFRRSSFGPPLELRSCKENSVNNRRSANLLHCQGDRPLRRGALKKHRRGAEAPRRPNAETMTALLLLLLGRIALRAGAGRILRGAGLVRDPHWPACRFLLLHTGVLLLHRRRAARPAAVSFDCCFEVLDRVAGSPACRSTRRRCRRACRLPCATARPQLPATNNAAKVSFVAFNIGCLLSAPSRRVVDSFRARAFAALAKATREHRAQFLFPLASVDACAVPFESMRFRRGCIGARDPLRGSAAPLYRPTFRRGGFSWTCAMPSRPGIHAGRFCPLRSHSTSCATFSIARRARRPAATSSPGWCMRSPARGSKS